MLTRSTSFMMKLAFLIFLLDMTTLYFQHSLLKSKITAHYYYVFMRGSIAILTLLVIAIAAFMILDHFTDDGNEGWVEKI